MPSAELTSIKKYNGITWLRAALTGMLGSLVMYAFLAYIIREGFAPFQLTPSAAFLYRLGLPIHPFGPLLHFLYGAFWSMVLLLIYDRQINIRRGIVLSFFAWLIFMTVTCPIIGWGFFGLATPADLPGIMQIHSPARFIVATAMLHLLFGLVIGGVNMVWTVQRMDE